MNEKGTIDCPMCHTQLFDGTSFVGASQVTAEYGWALRGRRELEIGCGACGYESQHPYPLPSKPQPKPEPPKVPDYTSPIFGVRQWKVSPEGVLGSTGVSHEWLPGEPLEAECRGAGSSAYIHRAASWHGIEHYVGPEPHAVPDFNCDCGAYAFRDLGTAKSYGDALHGSLVRGVVSSWGKVIECEHGVRAGRMKVEALILEQQTVRVMGSPVNVVAAQRRLAEKYGVPLILPGEIDSFAREKGLVRLWPEKLPEPDYFDAGSYAFGWGPPSPSSGWRMATANTPNPAPTPQPGGFKGWAKKIRERYGKD